MKKLIAFLTASFFALAAPGAESNIPPIFQLRLVLDAPSADSEPMTLVTESANHAFTNVLHVQRKVLLDHTALKSARAITDTLGHPLIDITLTDKGRRQLAEVTRDNLGKRLAIVIGGKLYQAPVIRTEITGGNAQITGSFSKEEAETLAKKMTDAIGQ